MPAGDYPAFPDVATMIAAWRPAEPVYCLYPRVLHAVTQRFLDGFPGTVLYAVKANPHEAVLQELLAAGVRDFDTASVPEMEMVHALDPQARCHFMAPVRLPGAALEAYERHRVRSMVVDHRDELARLLEEIGRTDLTVFVRLAVRDTGAMYDLSTKFGAAPDDAVALLRQVAHSGAEPALAFNAGSLVLDPDTYARALASASAVLARCGVTVRKLDVGGGFPSPYPGLPDARLQRFFEAFDAFAPQADAPIELLAEPGRALVAESLSLVAQVLLRKDDLLYLNDGVWGSFMEPVLSRGQVRYPTRVYREGTPLPAAETASFTLFGPTCDSTDRLPAPFPLPPDIRRGDWIEFGTMGAYSLTNRTGFNGFYPDTLVRIEGNAPPPRIADARPLPLP